MMNKSFISLFLVAMLVCGFSADAKKQQSHRSKKHKVTKVKKRHKTKNNKTISLVSETELTNRHVTDWRECKIELPYSIKPIAFDSQDGPNISYRKLDGELNLTEIYEDTKNGKVVLRFDFVGSAEEFKQMSEKMDDVLTITNSYHIANLAMAIGWGGKDARLEIAGPNGSMLVRNVPSKELQIDIIFDID